MSIGRHSNAERMQKAELLTATCSGSELVLGSLNIRQKAQTDVLLNLGIQVDSGNEERL